MTILFASGAEEPEAWVPALRSALPGESVCVDVVDRGAVEVAVVAAPPAGALRDLPALRFIQSLWMGVDSLLRDPELPRDVPLARMVDPGMTTEMPEAALASVLQLHRGHDVYARQQRARSWRQWPQRAARERCVGVLGLGELGARTARLLAGHGFRVHGWSRSAKRIEGVTVSTSLEDVLRASEILVNLLPLTSETRGVLDARRLGLLPRDAGVVNLARGDHVVEADLLAALESGQVRHAVLDTFSVEPLPPEHPFWTHPRVTVLPHVAAQSTLEACVPVVAENVRRLRAGEPLLHLVDVSRGY
jgi:glyoxylate/hydroxypyruvate reductase A